MLSDYFDLISIALKESYLIRIVFATIFIYFYFYTKGFKKYDN